MDLVMPLLVFACLLLYVVKKKTDSQAESNPHPLTPEAPEALPIKDELLAVLGHEVRTPAHGILGCIDLIESEQCGPISEEVRANLHMMRRSANRLLRLTEDLLSFSKIENGIEQLNLEAVEFDELLRHIQEEMKLFADEKRIAFVLDLPDPIGTVRTDTVKVGQILVNLIDNAIKFTDHGHVMISARRRHDLLELTVEDTGIGIEREDTESIFEPFTQGYGGTARKYSGTGLGLAIVRKWVGLLQGSVTLESEPGKGSRFVVRIPIGESICYN